LLDVFNQNGNEKKREQKLVSKGSFSPSHNIFTEILNRNWLGSFDEMQKMKYGNGTNNEQESLIQKVQPLGA